MAVYYHIEDDYYLVRDEWSWNIEKKVNYSKKEYLPLAYCITLEDALKYYLRLRQSESARKAPEGTIYDLIDILTTKIKTLTETLNKIATLYETEIPESMKDLRP